MRCEIRSEDLKAGYGEFVALDCDSLTFGGNTIAILGHNGAGKSTFIKCLLGLLPPMQGSIRCYIEREKENFEIFPEKHMAFCPETGAVFEDIPVKDYVELWCRIKHGEGAYYKKGGREIIEMLNLGPLLKRLGRELSKGQRRRVQTAIGFFTNPLLFMYDEPFDGLDVLKTSELADIIARYAPRMCSIISSHRMDVVERLADSVIVLREGKVIASGPVSTVAAILCPQCLLIDGITDTEPALEKFRLKYPSAIVCRLANKISISGENLTAEEILAFARGLEKGSFSVLSQPPSLTDAMNYHLKHVDYHQSRSRWDL